MQGERWTRLAFGAWVGAMLPSVLFGTLATACGESTVQRDPTPGSGGTGGTAGAGTGGAGGVNRGGSGSGVGGSGGGSGSGLGGGSTDGASGGVSASGRGGQATAGQGGKAGGATSGGASGRAAGGATNAGTSGSASGGEGGMGADEDCPADAAGTWALGDDNLFMVIESDCSVSNFCSIAEGIHTTGNVTRSMLMLQSVGGQPLAFAYTLTGDTLTLVDAGPSGPDPVDLPLSRTEEALPETCPTPR